MAKFKHPVTGDIVVAETPVEVVNLRGRGFVEVDEKPTPETKTAKN